jgi:hypothetical protein
MWPFHKEENVRQTYPPLKPGDKFKYLGIEMICTRNWYDIFDAVVAEYVNAHGEIKTLVFFPCDWIALNAELSANASNEPPASAGRLD